MKKKMIAAIATTLMLTSCNDFLADFLTLKPLNAVSVENYWEKKSEVESCIASCYYAMQDANFAKRVIAWGEMRADNITDNAALQNSENDYNYYINNITSQNTWCSWAAVYNVINLCNTVLYYAPGAQEKDGNFTKEELLSYSAEVRSIRALCYFYLIRTFKKVPLVTIATIGDDEDFKVAASNEEEVLAQIIEDLEWAKEHIWGERFFDTPAERKGRFNKLSVKAMLADVHLWAGNYALCAEYADEVIAAKQAEYAQQQQQVAQGDNELYYANGTLSLYAGYPLIDGTTLHYANQQIFITGNSFESLLELQYDFDIRDNSGVTSLYGSTRTLTGGMLSAANYIIDRQAGSLFEDVNDGRLTDNVNYDGFTTSNSYSILKYRAAKDDNEQIQMSGKAANWIIYRLTDVMLMRAEALAYLGGKENLQEAFLLVKAVNERACGGTSRLLTMPDDMKRLVLDERQRELMFEGKRWYDLMRMVRHADEPAKMMSTLRNTYLLRKYQTGGRDAVTRLASIDNLYLPFYQPEIDVNPLLEVDQNLAYQY